MNSAVSGANLGVSLISGSAGNGRIQPQELADNSAEMVEFKAILSDETVTPETLSQLEALLPPDQLSRLEALLKNGKGLPLSADIAEDSLLGSPALLQLMMQITPVEGPGRAVSDAVKGPQSSVSTLTVAGLQGMLARAGGGDRSVDSEGQAKSSFGLLSDDQAAILLQKQDVAVSLQPAKLALMGSDLSSGLLQGHGPTSTLSLSPVVSGLEQLAAQRSETATPAPLTVPPGEKGWDNVLSNRIMWMVGKQMQQATLQISPRHLGPIDIQVSMHNDQTSLSFMAHNTVVKEALESAIPRLREMFADSNMSLVNVDVGQREAGSQGGGADLFQQAGGRSVFSSGGSRQGEDGVGATDSGPVRITTSSGILDDYA